MYTLVPVGICKQIQSSHQPAKTLEDKIQLTRTIAIDQKANTMTTKEETTTNHNQPNACNKKWKDGLLQGRP
jgi:Tfp pilus assembly protein FimT